jgi:hypothetical protein
MAFCERNQVSDARLETNLTFGLVRWTATIAGCFLAIRGNVFKNITFVPGVFFNDRDQIRDEIVPFSQLHIDAGPGFFNAVPRSDEAVV